MKEIQIIPLQDEQKQNIKLPEGSVIEGVTIAHDNGQGKAVPSLIVKVNKSTKDFDDREIMIYATGEKIDEFDLEYIGSLPTEDSMVHIYENKN